MRLLIYQLDSGGRDFKPVRLKAEDSLNTNCDRFPFSKIDLHLELL